MIEDTGGSDNNRDEDDGSNDSEIGYKNDGISHNNNR